MSPMLPPCLCGERFFLNGATAEHGVNLVLVEAIMRSALLLLGTVVFS